MSAQTERGGQAFYFSIAIAGGDGVNMPRRKYGRLKKSFKPTPVEKCRYCIHNKPCPIHKKI